MSNHHQTTDHATSTRAVRATTSRGMSFTRRGSGPAVVLIHGWCLDHRMWIYAEERLATKFTVLSPDLPGFGHSHALAGPYIFERYADDVRALINEAMLRDVVLVGFALGAAVALNAAAKDASGISAVFSIGMPDPSASPYSKMPNAMRRDWPAFARKSAEVLFHTQQSEATIAWLERIFGGASLPVAIEVVHELGRLDAPSMAATAANVRQHYLHARQDSVAPISFGEKCVAAGGDRSTLEIIEECGHLIVLDNKAAFHERLEAFLAAEVR